MAGERRRERIRTLLRRAGVPGADAAAVAAAFVHASAVRERVEQAQNAEGAWVSNERLEFLGDSIIGYAVARAVFEMYPGADEGELALRKAALVSDAALADTAKRLHLGALLIVGSGHRVAGPGRTMLADAFEAFVAATALAAGLPAAVSFIEREHVARAARSTKPLADPKTLLQEWTQKRHRSIPTYADRYDGPAHARTFHARVWVEDEWLAEGSGASKKDAERAAALRALELLAERHGDPGLAQKTPAVKSSRRATSKARRT